MKILFASSECTPFAKTGGLADVVGALPKVLRRMGHDARVLLPLYASIDRAQYGVERIGPCCIHMGHGEENWGVWHQTTIDGEVPVWFVEHGRYFDRPGFYNDAGGDYADNAYRFAFLSKAALQICKDMDFIPEVIHTHDWPTALVPLFLKTWDRILSPLSDTASVLTIHNVGYQGKYHASVLGYLGVGWEYFSPHILEDFGGVNLLKAGIALSEAITTVSPTYRKEILDPVGGCGLAMSLNDRSADLFGILNGVDYEEWNPQTDTYITAPYSPSKMKGKAACKQALQRRMGLDVDNDAPLFGIVARFAPQKGFNLLREILAPALSQMNFQLAVLGTGDPATEEFFRRLADSFPGRVGAHIGFSVELSHWIEAGSDFFLMPSLYEPCGLNQIYSLKYGTLPLVRATGGLEDTVENYNEATGGGTGFKFIEPTGSALQDTIGWAVSTWYDRPHHIQSLRKNAMAQDFSWDKSARQYESVYEYAVRKLHGG